MILLTLDCSGSLINELLMVGYGREELARNNVKVVCKRSRKLVMVGGNVAAGSRTDQMKRRLTWRPPLESRMSDLMSEEKIDRDTPESNSLSTEDRRHEGAESPERLTDRLARTKSFDDSHAEWLRVQALTELRPDYGTFLKDEELIELFPEAAETYHVDDIRRALMMIRMILDYGESAFTRDEGEAVYILITCILLQEDYWFDGTWSANNPAARERDVLDRRPSMPGLNFDTDDDGFDWDTDKSEICSGKGPQEDLP